jgi:hypothetical protein
MASTLDLYIDTSSGQLIDGGSVIGGALPTFTRNDAYTLRLRLLEKKANGSLDDIDFGSSSLKAGIGNIEEVPSGGSFKLAINGVTSSAIAYNATAISVYNAISNNVSTVALYGSGSFGSYLLTATQPNTAMSFSPDAFTLFPSSSALISTRRNPATSIEAQQVVKLVRNPIVYADTFIATPTAGELAITLLQNGTTAANETYELTVGPLARGGSFALVFGPNATTAIPLFQSAVSVQAAISSGINTITSNISVQENGKGGYIIAFTGRLGLTNITTQLALDASGIQFIPMRQTTLTINTAEVEDAFAVSGETTITPTLEIELTQGGTPKTIYQGSVNIRKDLITAGSTVPGARDSYYTKSETNALFVQNSTTGVDSQDRYLYDSSGLVALDWGNRALYDSSTSEVLNYTAGIQFAGSLMGFYGSSVTAKPSGVNIVSGLTNLGLLSYTQPTAVNVVSGLINTGLIASGATYGVLPQSPRTLTTVTFFGPVTVGGNDVNSTTVSIVGAQPNDICMLGLPTNITHGITFFSYCVTAGQVHIDLLNVTGTQKIQTAATYRVTVIGY